MFERMKIINNIKLITKLQKGFPSSLSKEVELLCKKLRAINPEKIYYAKSYMWLGEKVADPKNGCAWVLSCGEEIRIPYRIYFEGTFRLYESYSYLSKTEKIIYHCIFSRSDDGFTREGHLRALLRMGADEYEWVKPYIISPAGEYVVEMVDVLYKEINREKIPEYRAFCKLNFENIRYLHANMITYWAEFRRNEYYRYKDYIGKNLFAEVFGMRKSGQKSIEIN